MVSLRMADQLDTICGQANSGAMERAGAAHTEAGIEQIASPVGRVVLQIINEAKYGSVSSPAVLRIRSPRRTAIVLGYPLYSE